jgi:hypothetical protein
MSMAERDGLAAEIAEVIGDEAAARLLSKRGGTRLDIPRHAGGSLLADLVGLQNAALLIRHFGHGALTLPISSARGSGAARARGHRMLAEGGSLLDVALACGVTTRTVSNWRAEMDRAADSRQMTLPFDRS